MKRIVDLLLSIVGLIFLIPLIVVLSAIIISIDGFPIIFKQRRAGLKGEVFTLYKLRTMKPILIGENDIQDKSRITKLGNFLRKSSLDEIPSILNVIRGEMSIVGPRPLLPEYLKLYSAEQNRRHDVKPGITGWTQINGRNTISWDKKFEYDIWYVENQSLALDIKIIFLTIWKVLLQRDINKSDEETMGTFEG
ncbi:sugar transferase [Candidatus Marinimicrobia bacterium MT.SAG.2]|nr:sugar transferase [Candidatus Marinimicrobia bacterium MT.SAG.2]